MSKNKKLWDAKTPALTPDFVSKCGTVFHTPAVTPDTRVEALLYHMLTAEQRKNTRLIEVLRKERAVFADYKRHRIVRAVARKLTVNPSDKAAN